MSMANGAGFRRAACACLTLVFCYAATGAEEPLPQNASVSASNLAAYSDKRAFFESRIRPVLVSKCYECHSSEAKTVRGGLLLDTREGLRAGGDSGPVLVEGDPENSLLMEALRHDGLEMPPDGKLDEAVIAAFARWIADGAVDPRVGERSDARPSDERRSPDDTPKSWAFQAVRRPPLPAVQNGHWAESPIDRFVLARLEAERLAPAAEAEPAALLRRLTFDLIGLPPTPEQLQRFLRDPSREAYRAEVDRLLQSPQFGERWGRHWLDVARFAESSGGGRSLMFHDAWRYRDYVIDAFNRDMPFDQFVMEQIAGDLMESASDQEQDRRIVGTGFLAMGAINYELQDKELLNLEIADEQVDTIGRAILGMTVGCARCHDHKFDAISMRDYYALAGIFAGTESVIHANVSKYVERPLRSDAQWAYYASHQARLDDAKKRLKELSGQQASSEEMAELEKEVKQLERTLQRKPVAMSVGEGKQPSDMHLRIRGEPRNLGPAIPRGVLSAIGTIESPQKSELVIAKGSSGRLEFAKWLVAEENPLTQRVIANRVWHYLLGQGLVRTTDNFGEQGERPTHPELLDFLASELVQSGWSLKSLIRQIVLSNTYRQSSSAAPESRAVDPRNQLLSHANRKPLDAESIRDAMLFVSGKLDMTQGGLTIENLQEYDTDYEFQSMRRSVYVPRFRNSVLDLFQVFDAANPNMVTGQRNSSVLPTQALYMMNSPFVRERAAAAAERILEMDLSCDDERWRWCQLAVVGRPITEREVEFATVYLSEQRATHAAETEIWANYVQLLFASLDFRYLR